MDHCKKQAITVNNGVQEDVVVDNESKILMTANGGRSNDFASELETYLDALATIESEIETDFESQIKHENELLTLNHQDLDLDMNGDQLCQPSENCRSLVKKSYASCDSNCSFVKGEQEISYIDSLHGLTDRKLPQVTKVLPIDDSLETMNAPSHSQDPLELVGAILGNLCDKPSTTSAENAHISLTDDVLVGSSASNGLPIVEEMHHITLAEDGENSIEASISNTIDNTPFESAASCLMSEDAVCGSAEHASASNHSSLKERSGPDEGQIVVPVMTSDSKEHCKSVKTPNSDDVQFEGANPCQMSGDVSYSQSHDKPDLNEIYMPVSVMIPKSNGQDKFVDSLVSDTLDSMHSKVGGEQPPCTFSTSNGTFSFPCSHEGSGLEELQIPQGSSVVNADTTSALQLSTTFTSNEIDFNSFDDQLVLPDASCQLTIAKSQVEASMQCPGEEPEQRESGMLTKEVSIDLSKLQHGEMDASRENIAPDENLELIRTITTIEDENCVIIDESLETTAASILTQSDQKCVGERTHILSQHDAVINESAEADITSYESHVVYIAENVETLNSSSIKVINTTQVTYFWSHLSKTRKFRFDINCLLWLAMNALSLSRL